MTDTQARLAATEVEERWAAIAPSEREAFLRFGTKAAPWESVPDYAERILKADPKITLAGARTVAVIFRCAYNELAA
jgi:hypothetical protein